MSPCWFLSNGVDCERRKGGCRPDDIFFLFTLQSLFLGPLEKIISMGCLSARLHLWSRRIWCRIFHIAIFCLAKQQVFFFIVLLPLQLLAVFCSYKVKEGPAGWAKHMWAKLVSLAKNRWINTSKGINKTTNEALNFDLFYRFTCHFFIAVHLFSFFSSCLHASFFATNLILAGSPIDRHVRANLTLQTEELSEYPKWWESARNNRGWRCAVHGEQTCRQGRGKNCSTGASLHRLPTKKRRGRGPQTPRLQDEQHRQHLPTMTWCIIGIGIEVEMPGGEQLYTLISFFRRPNLYKDRSAAEGGKMDKL